MRREPLPFPLALFASAMDALESCESQGSPLWKRGERGDSTPNVRNAGKNPPRSPFSKGGCNPQTAPASLSTDNANRAFPFPTGSVADTLLRATTRLESALELDRREARLEARILAARALGVDRAWLVAHDRDALGPDQDSAIEALVARREAGEPVAYILGEKEFYGRTFKVTPDVLIPRPETELLVEAALARLPKDRPAKILDLGTGSGCIAITLALERPDCAVTGVDLSPAALDVARGNAAFVRRGADTPVRFLVSNWFGALAGGRFDLIVSNPPYVAEADPHLMRGDLRFEPCSALSSGVRGLDDIERLAAQAPGFLEPGGVLLFEHGWDQAAACRNLLEFAGFSDVATLADLNGQDRVTVGRWPGVA